jgi:hypothetical protein
VLGVVTGEIVSSGGIAESKLMALNPPLLPGSTLPLPVNGETFVLQRKGVQLDADILVCTLRTNGYAARAASIKAASFARCNGCLHVGVIVPACRMYDARMQAPFLWYGQALVSLSGFAPRPLIVAVRAGGAQIPA